MSIRYDLAWGRYHAADVQFHALHWRNESLPELKKSMLPWGCGRSYGDSCLNDGGNMIAMRGLNRLMDFDSTTGLLRCEAGVTLAEILDYFVPRGWFVPVTPGTKFVTVGGAIANDVHGKNHGKQGTFGCHVPHFELLRSDGSRLFCSSNENAELYKATIGGLGLTGAITWADVQLRRVANPFMLVETVQYESFQEFLQLQKSSREDYEYTVAWVDCLATDKQLGRGLFMRANHAAENAPIDVKVPSKRKLSVPFSFPHGMLNQYTLKAFNYLYYNRVKSKTTRAYSHYDPFFYPLDAIHHWNRIYGPRGFFQHQCVIPHECSESMQEIMRRIASANAGSFLTVLKEFGEIESPGMLSFPKPGLTFALDFPNNGRATLRLLDSLDDIVRDAGGRIYPAKDARMSPQTFQQGYPQWEAFKQYIDPKFNSSFWRRVTAS